MKSTSLLFDRVSASGKRWVIQNLIQYQIQDAKAMWSSEGHLLFGVRWIVVTAKPTLEERDVTYQSAVRFCEKNPQAILEIMDEDIMDEYEHQ